MDTHTLKNGTVLRLRPVKWTAAWHIIKKLGGAEVMNDPDILMDLTGDDALRAADATEQLFNYCAGWGVENKPPEDAMEELEMMGLSMPDKPHLARANWLRFVELADDGEASAVIGAVLALSMQKVQEIKETREIQEEIESQNGS